MTQTKPGEQSIRRAARQAAVAAQARRRAKAAERDKRLEAAALTLIVTLKERDALERRAGAAIRAMLTDGLTLSDIPPGPTARPPSRKPPDSPTWRPRTERCHEHSTSMPVTSSGTVVWGSDRHEADQRSGGAGRQGSPDEDRGRPASPDHRQSALARLHCRPSPDDRSGRHCPRRVRPGTSHTSSEVWIRRSSQRTKQTRPCGTFATTRSSATAASRCATRAQDGGNPPPTRAGSSARFCSPTTARSSRSWSVTAPATWPPCLTMRGASHDYRSSPIRQPPRRR